MSSSPPSHSSAMPGLRPEILLDKNCCIGSCQNSTSAKTKNREGLSVEVSFEIRDPPALSLCFARCYDAAGRQRCAQQQTNILCAAGGLALLSVPSSDGGDVDFFVYRAGPGVPSLHLLPGPYPTTFQPSNFAVLPICDDDDDDSSQHFAVVLPDVELFPFESPERIRYTLHVYRSDDSNAWRATQVVPAESTETLDAILEPTSGKQGFRGSLLSRARLHPRQMAWPHRPETMWSGQGFCRAFCRGPYLDPRQKMSHPWMYGNRCAPAFREGVNSFLLVAEANKSKQGFMCCPCLKCKNEKDYSCSRDIKSHLHGEEGVMMEDGDEEEDNDDQYRSMFSECDDTAMDDNEEEGGEEQASDDPVDDDLRRAISDARRDCGTDKERLQFDKMLEDHHKLLYPGCEDGHRKLGSILELLKWKAEVGVTDSGFEKLMIILKKLFPRNNELPVSTYEAKKLVCPLGLDVQKIHACINDCILYRGEKYENLNKCPICGALRYKIRKDDPGDVEGEPPRKRVPAKVMWYAPIIPRLKRLFRNKEHAQLLRWHMEERKKDAMLRHPADGRQWRNIGREFPDFAETMDPFERDLEQEDIFVNIIRDGDGEAGGSGDGEAAAPVLEKPTAPVMEKPTAPVMTREWNKTKKVSENQVADRYKNTLFDDLMAHFTLPDLGSESENAKQRALVKKWALKKMGELFRAYKNRLWATYKAEKKPPVFENYLSKQEHNWEEFVKYKESEEAVNLSKKNQKNASEKKYHHHTGRGGYEVAMPKWDAQEAEMERNGITPEPTREGWDIRARNWFLAHGCEYDMKTGNIVESDSRVRVPREKWIEVTAEIKAGKLKFAPDREKDLLTLVLGNPEKGGRTRGFGPSVPWSLGFPADAETYRRARAKQRELQVQNDRMAEFQRRLDQQQREIQQQQLEINELKGQRQPDNTAGISQQRDSSVADSEVAPPLKMIDGGPGDPMDGIKEQTPCDLHDVFRNVSVKVAVGYVLPAFGAEGEPATWHGSEIPAGFARVGVDSVVPSWETLQLDIPGGDGGLHSERCWEKSFSGKEEHQAARLGSP
ncbi:hypothetical protein QYE76_012803 [Lolium multiflorum]|uniref:Transposon protein, putative, CACTA, En/Spm sub-class n=1 Tax=Lolium multiflorum TaxID=4521 RepID=A0AAD8X493_LOLMU|nr:hypothetical protein QYE76_012803 [Lolium multiflorum]